MEGGPEAAFRIGIYVSALGHCYWNIFIVCPRSDTAFETARKAQVLETGAGGADHEFGRPVACFELPSNQVGKIGGCRIAAHRLLVLRQSGIHTPRFQHALMGYESSVC